MPDDAAEPVLSAGARRRVLELAAAALGAMPEPDVPATLARVRAFARGRRASAGAAPLAAAVARDKSFRLRVAGLTRTQEPELAAAVESGQPPAAADPDQVAALAYVLRPTGWPALVERATGSVGLEAVVSVPSRELDAERLSAEVTKARAQVRQVSDDAAQTRARLEAELTALRKEARRHRSDADRARAEAREAHAAAEQVRSRSAEQVLTAQEQARRAMRDLAEVSESLRAQRRAERAGRSLAGSRARLLLDTVVEAAVGLRNELALPAADTRPADSVEAELGPAGEPLDPPSRGRAPDDPAVLDELLSLPQSHLVVDGYNVTKSAYGTLPLADQRHRLLGGLVFVQQRTRCEITCVFDGGGLEGRVAAPSVRGVRVLFSAADDSADDLILRLVRAEPVGRVVVVVSSDREVADGARAAGARSVPSTALARLLDRG